MVKQISSSQNSMIKELVQLKLKARSRKKNGLFLIEGRREINLALKGGYKISKILFDQKILSLDEILDFVSDRNLEIIEITSEIYSKLAYRSNTEGIIAIAEGKKLGLENIQLRNKDPLILVAEAPEKPGNIGALLRTADAAKVDAFLIANAKTDLYNPNIIRSSVGCLFTNQIGFGTSEEIIDFLKKNDIPIYCAALVENAEKYCDQDYTTSSAIVVGTEATGLTNIWLDNSFKNIAIPMQGEIDSMNVSVSAGILIFEAKRQRDFL